MKKYFIFAISFILLFGLFQVLAGLIPTLMYTPNISEAWQMGGESSAEGVLYSTGGNTLLIFAVAFLSATIAYFVPKRLFKLN